MSNIDLPAAPGEDSPKGAKTQNEAGVANGLKPGIDFSKTSRAGDVSLGTHEERTIAVVKKRTGIDPVVGWIVCVEGLEKGKDYRIHSEKNMIGRADNMDIVVKDPTISRENHASIVFEPKHRVFLIQSGDGRGLIYVNGNVITNAQSIAPYDLIEMGESKFRFLPFCGDKFNWEGDSSVEYSKA
ncbi:MAG: FHA domain-containing protein [Synergistaceae bacterium]|nr:FHA domain-containing protein [Synergistaceae bacterium]